MGERSDQQPPPTTRPTGSPRPLLSWLISWRRNSSTDHWSPEEPLEPGLGVGGSLGALVEPEEPKRDQFAASSRLVLSKLARSLHQARIGCLVRQQSLEAAAGWANYRQSAPGLAGESQGADLGADGPARPTAKANMIEDLVTSHKSGRRGPGPGVGSSGAQAAPKTGESVAATASKVTKWVELGLRRK